MKAFPGAVYKKLATLAEANAFIQRRMAASAIASTSAATSTNSPSVDEGENAFDVVYCDGACSRNGQAGSVAGIGVWWGPGDPRSVSVPRIPRCGNIMTCRNLSERCPGDQTNNRAELIVSCRCHTLRIL